MSQELNNLLLDELCEAHGLFQNTIAEMQQNGISYKYDEVIKMEENSYTISYNAISKLNSILERYNYLCVENEEYFKDEKKIFIKYIFLYLVSIILIKVFSKTLSAAKINEIWYAIIGMVLGSANATLIGKSINNYRNDSKDKRELNNSLITLKEEYNANYDIAAREVNYLFSLARNLSSEVDESKTLSKSL